MQNTIIEREVRAGTSERNIKIRTEVKSPTNPDGKSQASLAREYRVTPSAICQIVNRKDSQPEENIGFLRRIWKVVRRRCQR